MAYRRRTAWSLVLGVLAAAPAGARADVAELPPLTVSGEPQPPELSAIGDGDLEAAPAPALGELLRLLPGVHVDRAGAAGGVASLYLRGADPNFTAVLVDGIRVNDPTNTRGGSVDFAAVTVDDFERAELLRGPASALYGADAQIGRAHV